MDDVLKNEMPVPIENRESVRGKLEYYQEVIHQNENIVKENNELEI